MSKRLQVLVREEELAVIRELAERERLTVAAWVRRALDELTSRFPDQRGSNKRKEPSKDQSATKKRKALVPDVRPRRVICA